MCRHIITKLLSLEFLFSILCLTVVSAAFNLMLIQSFKHYIKVIPKSDLHGGLRAPHIMDRCYPRMEFLDRGWEDVDTKRTDLLDLLNARAKRRFWVWIRLQGKEIGGIII